MILSPPVISIKDVSFVMDAHRILSQVSLVLNEGEILVLVGPSGHGKTTLLKIMAGLLSPTEGEMRLYGEDWSQLNNAMRNQLLKKMGMLFQKNALFDSLTCGENIAFPLREVTSLEGSEIRDKVEYFLEAVGLSGSKDLFPDEISGGMQKRLGIARALALEPKLIFYDDPTAGLDPITSKKIIELIIQDQKKRNSTVVAITNDMNRAYQMAHRIGFVFSGEFLDAGNSDETKKFQDPRVQQFIRGSVSGPLMESN